MSVRSDAELAQAWQAGDHTAFAEAYEKYSSSLFGVAMGLVRDRTAAADIVHDTFVRAAGRIGGLRNPDRLRAWLFAILRNEATDLLRGRGREGAGDAAAMSEHLAADLPEPHTELSRSELADVVWSAAEALQQRDREVLELHVRAGLEAGDLADALGVTPGHAAVLLSRMRDRMEKAIGALLIARLGRRACGTLDGLLARWDGRFTLDVRSRVTRHVESCPVCTRSRRQLASYQRLAPAVLPVFLVPEGLRHKVLSSLDLVSNQTALGHPDGPDGPDVAGQGRADHGGNSARGGVDSWSWREDGFPEPQPAKPSGTVADSVPDDDAAGLGGRPPQPPPSPGSGSGPGVPVPVPRQRRGVRTGLLAAGAIALLVAGGFGAWKVNAKTSPSTSAVGSPAGAGTAQSAGGGATTDPSAVAGTTGAPGITGTATGGTTSPSSTAPGTPSGVTTASGVTTPSGTATTGATTSPVAARLTAGPSRMSFGGGTSSSSTRRSITLKNSGGQQLSWTASRSGAGFSMSPASGTLGAGQSATVTVTLNRSGLAEGPVSGAADINATPTGQTFHIALSGSVNNPPVFSTVSFPQTTLSVRSTATSCRYPTISSGYVTVTDDTTPTKDLLVSVSGDGPGSPATMTWDGNFYGAFGPFTNTGAHTATVTATDQFGNSAKTTVNVTVTTC